MRPSTFILLLRGGASGDFADVVFRFGDAHDPLIKPADDVLQALDAMPDVEKTSLFGVALHAVLRSETVNVDAIAARLREAGLRVDAIERVVPSLEDVFLDVVDKAGEQVA